MSVHVLSAEERAQEILGFSQDFLSAVTQRIVHRSEPEGGGYALTSKVRPDYHIPTVTAAASVAASMDMLRSQVHASGERVPLIVIDEMRKARDTFCAAARFIDKDPRLANGYYIVRADIGRSVPDMDQVLRSLEP
ncbi:MAG: hypothetical protein AUJ12_04315 [Alphaproteobacteria bacterium CG1_02_46_17]|nr:MAG: hypothetical protein AUJ12_04315 [Alphaproteobacteria bacterium CG1_02_46_17]